MTETRRWQLREATATAHAAVDATVGSFHTLDGYRQYLVASHTFREPIERALASIPWPAALAGWRPALVADALRADLDDLGVRLPSLDPAEPPQEISRLLGTLYVLEGSVLGARLLYERARTLGLDETRGARHLALLARDIDGWRTFLTLLETADPFDLDHATTASLETFAAAQAAYRRMTHA